MLISPCCSFQSQRVLTLLTLSMFILCTSQCSDGLCRHLSTQACGRTRPSWTWTFVHKESHSCCCLFGDVAAEVSISTRPLQGDHSVSNWRWKKFDGFCISTARFWELHENMTEIQMHHLVMHCVIIIVIMQEMLSSISMCLPWKGVALVTGCNVWLWLYRRKISCRFYRRPTWSLWICMRVTFICAGPLNCRFCVNF